MAAAKPTILPHGEIEAIGPNLWRVAGSLKIPIKRCMIVARLPHGGLVLHSVVAMDEAGMAALEKLGTPEIMIVPNGGHRLDAPFYKRRYPQLKVVAPAACRAKIEEVIAVDATDEEALAPLGWKVHVVEGFKSNARESVYEVPLEGGGKALLCCDVLGGGEPAPHFLLRLTGVPGGGFGVARIMRWFFIKDLAAIKALLERLAAVPDLRLLTVAHGPVQRDAIADKLRAAAAGL